MYEVYRMYKVCKVYEVLLPPAPQASYPTSVGFIGIDRISNIFKMLLDGSSGFFGARLLQN